MMSSRRRAWIAALLGCAVTLGALAGCSSTGGPKLVWNKPEKKSTGDDKSLAAAKSSEKDGPAKDDSKVKIIDPKKLMAKVDKDSPVEKSAEKPAGEKSATETTTAKVATTGAKNSDAAVIQPLSDKFAAAGTAAPSTESPFQSSRSAKSAGASAPEMPVDADPWGTSPRAGAAAQSASNTDQPPATSLAGSSMTPATLRLIDQELQGASAEERAYWYDQLKKVDPAVVPQILQARRMSLQLTARQEGQPSSTGDPWAEGMSAAGGQAAWGHSASATKPVQAQGGMGAASPWGPPDRSLTSDTGKSRVSAIQLAGHGDDSSLAAGNASSGVVNAGHRVEDGTPERVRSAFYRVDADGQPASQIQQQSHVETGQTTNPAAGNAVAVVPSASPAALPNGARFGSSQLPVMPGSPINSSPAGFSAPAGDRLDQLIGQTEASVNLLTRGDSPESQDYYLRQHVFLRLLYLMADRPERALAAIPGIPPAEQEFWQQMLWGMSNYFDSKQIPQSADRASQAVAQFQSGVSKLKQMARLELRNVTFCKQIWYFGNYEKFPRDEFRPGQEVLVYAEAENFQSELTAEGQYRTLLRSKIDIISPAGEIRHQIEFPPTEDLCRNERRDYFHNYQFTIPDKMPLGPHSLKLTVFDELSGRVTSSSINFVVK
jgi:hypothetical protein